MYLFADAVNWLAILILFILSAGAYRLAAKWAHSIVSGIVAAVSFFAILASYSITYDAVGYPQWMRWFATREPTMVRAEAPSIALPQVNTSLKFNWKTVGFNDNWVVLVAKDGLGISTNPSAYVRWEHKSQQQNDGGKPYWSEVQLLEFDCHNGRWNLLLNLHFAGSDLSGPLVYSARTDQKAPQWETEEEGSILAAVTRTACELYDQ